VVALLKMQVVGFMYGLLMVGCCTIYVYT